MLAQLINCLDLPSGSQGPQACPVVAELAGVDKQPHLLNKIELPEIVDTETTIMPINIPSQDNHADQPMTTEMVLSEGHRFLFGFSMELCDSMIMHLEGFAATVLDLSTGVILRQSGRRDRFLTWDAFNNEKYEEGAEKLVYKHGEWKVTNEELAREWVLLKADLDRVCDNHRREVLALLATYKGLENLSLILGERKPVGALETLDIQRQEKAEFSKTLRLTGKNLKLVKKCILQMTDDMVDLKHYGRSISADYLLKMKNMYAGKFFKLLTKFTQGVKTAVGEKRCIFAVSREAHRGFILRVITRYLTEGRWAIVLAKGMAYASMPEVQSWLFTQDCENGLKIFSNSTLESGLRSHGLPKPFSPNVNVAFVTQHFKADVSAELKDYIVDDFRENFTGDTGTIEKKSTNTKETVDVGGVIDVVENNEYDVLYVFHKMDSQIDLTSWASLKHKAKTLSECECYLADLHP